MGVRITNDTEQNVAALCCSTSGTAFGPIFEGHEQAECFLDWFADGQAAKAAAELHIFPTHEGHDPREYGEDDLLTLHSIWQGTAFDKAGKLAYAELPDGSTDWVWRTRSAV